MFQQLRSRGAVQIAALCGCAVLLLLAGLALRRIAWNHSDSIRADFDMRNAWKWGTIAAREGYFQLYDRVVADHPERDFGLDYLPLRLAVFDLWARREARLNPGVAEWQRAYAFNAFLLDFNSLLELSTAAGMFALCWHWIRRSAADAGARRAAWIALLPAALCWINPASIASAHVRPTWDVWLTPFYLWAIFAACIDRWFLAGCLIAIGAMFKGQLLICAPVFVLWPLMGWKLDALGRWLAGVVIGITAIVLPWLVPARIAPILFVVAIAALFPAVSWITTRYRPAVRPLLRRAMRWLVPLAITTAAWLCVPMFGGSLAWATVGLVYGGEKFNALETGGASNLSAILELSYGLKHDDLTAHLPFTRTALTIEQLLFCIFATLLIVCAFAMARTQRRNDRRFLLAMAAPWLAYFAICPRMHERYLLWGATLACAAAAVSLGPALLAIFFIACSTVMSLFQMLSADHAPQFLTELSPTFGTTLREAVRGTFPGIGWAILLATATWFYLMLMLGRRERGRMLVAPNYSTTVESTCFTPDEALPPPMNGEAGSIVTETPAPPGVES